MAHRYIYILIGDGWVYFWLESVPLDGSWYVGARAVEIERGE